MTDALLLVHAGATLYMAGLIWFVQVVHYPLFAAVGEREWIRYETLHQTRTTFVVLPPMLVELITAGWLAWLVVVGESLVPAWMAWTGLSMVVLLWLSTFAVQVPLHAALSRAHARPKIQALVRSNWLRTVLWSARGVLALWMLA